MKKNKPILQPIPQFIRICIVLSLPLTAGFWFLMGIIYG